MKLFKAINNKIRKSFMKVFGIKTPVYIPTCYGDFLKDRTVLITGGASGIGFAIAEACVNNGAFVVLAARNEEKLKKACGRLNREKEISSYVLLDLLKNDQFDDVIKKAVNNTPSKKIDTLINNAGVSQGKQFGNTSKNALDVVFDTNVKGIYLFSQEFAKYLIQKGIKGNIHNVCSSSSNRPAASPYSISKWAEAGLTKGMAKSLIKNDIVVNAVAPGPTASGMMMTASDGDLSRKTSPSGRFVTAEEIANLSVFLISQASRMVVGETVFMTGGMGTLTFDDVNYDSKIQ